MISATSLPQLSLSNDILLAKHLELGNIAYYPVCPFPLPKGEDLQFLLQQRLSSRAHKNISFNPHTGKSSGFAYESSKQAEQLRVALAHFAKQASYWLANILPTYATSWQLDRVSYRPEEEATRHLRLSARNDLIHVDAFPSRPTNGWRILRLFVNINPTESRIWATAQPFPSLLDDFSDRISLPHKSAPNSFRTGLLRIIQLLTPTRARRSLYDTFMLQFHNFLKANQEFQQNCKKQIWHFQPGSLWLAMTDVCSHSVLRGRFALEHSYFINPASQALPSNSPAALLERLCQIPVLRNVA